MTLKTVISGAQVGADIAGLRAATVCGIDTSGWIPKGGRTLKGPLDQKWIDHYNLIETASATYPQRTEMNVKNSDATIRLAHNWHSPGERLTARLLLKHGKPFWDVMLGKTTTGGWAQHQSWSVQGESMLFSRSFASTTAQWLRDQQVTVLNIAGNGDETIEAFCEWFLVFVFIRLKEIDGVSNDHEK